MYQYKLNEQEISNLNLVISNDVREDIETLSNYFLDKGYELYLVGGCVRDILLHKKPHDYDLCTNATPTQVKEILEGTKFKTWDSGVKHGTLTITSHHDRESFEITTYRNDGDYEDHRHPTNVTFSTSIEEDLKRRDFTINSFALNLNDSIVLMLDESYLDDLKYKVIRCVGNPNDRFDEDALRILRAFRFSAQLDFTIESNTLEAILTHKNDLTCISRERVRDEINKILLSDNPLTLHWLSKYDIPFGLSINEEAFKHLVCIPKDLKLRWTWLLMYSIPSSEYEDNEDFLKQTMKMDTNTSNDILKMTHLGIDILSNKNISDYTIKTWIAYLGVKLFDKCLTILRCLLDDYKIYDRIKEVYIRVVKNNEPLYVKDLAINGNDIINDEFLEGKEIGDCLNWMLGIVLVEPSYNNRDKLLELLEDFKEMSFQNS